MRNLENHASFLPPEMRHIYFVFCYNYDNTGNKN